MNATHTSGTIADVIKQMLADWNAATPEQRAAALKAAADFADAVERRILKARVARG